MKKVLLAVAVIATIGLTSCGGDEEASGPALCDCVNDKAESDEDKEACKEMEKEWKEKYKDASDEEKEEMKKEIEACEK